MSQLKLTADSGGGTVAIKGPASTTGNGAIELTVPGTGSSTLATTATAGKILQVVSTTKTDSTSTTTSGSFTDISGMSVSITPSSTSSKIFIIISLGSVSSNAGIAVGFRLLRDSTEIGSASSGIDRKGFTTIYAGAGTGDEYILSASHSFLDSPSTTSSTTYKLQWRTSGAASYLNKYWNNNENNGSSTITVMEVAA
tara:strand:+ start:1955 stop:2548 length:594 start_codon:yes stop_codon:yes gene_type:complete